MSEKKILSIEFPDQAALEHFAIWFCESGEQNYWNWCEINESPTRIIFTFHHPQDARFERNDPRRYEKAEFCRDNKILTEINDED
jgi:hypothetical protein